MTTLNLDVPRPEPRRDRWGRYLVTPADGGKPRAYTRATTFAKALDDQSSLINWSMRMCALGLTARKDLFAQIAACRPDDRDTLSKLVDQAKEAGGGSEGANIGTALHAFAERVDLGETVEIPDLWAPDIDAYTKAIAEYGLMVRPELVERVVVLEQLGVAGTLDRVYQTGDGRLLLGDLKTGATLEYNRLAISIQLAIYANANTLYDLNTETHTPMVNVDKTTALVVHVPSGQGRCEIFEVDIAAGWRYVQLAGEVRAARAHGRRTGGDSLFVKAAGQQLSETMPAHIPHEYYDWTVNRLNALRANPDAVRAMTANWPDGVPGMKSGHTHTLHELGRIATVLDKVEATFGLPFGDPDPRTPKPTPRPEPVPRVATGLDEGTDMPRDAVDTLIKQVDALPETTRKQLNSWAAEAHKAGRAFSIKAKPSYRRWRIYEACLLLAEFDDDMVRACLAACVPPSAQFATPIGAVLGGLSIEQANQLIGLTITVKQQTPALVYGDDGAVRWATFDEQISETHNNITNITTRRTR